MCICRRHPKTGRPLVLYTRQQVEDDRGIPEGVLERILTGSQKNEAIMKGLGARGNPSVMATLKQHYEEKYEA